MQHPLLEIDRNVDYESEPSGVHRWDDVAHGDRLGDRRKTDSETT
jgi:hypothetical protein